MRFARARLAIAAYAAPGPSCARRLLRGARGRGGLLWCDGRSGREGGRSLLRGRGRRRGRREDGRGDGAFVAGGDGVRGDERGRGGDDVRDGFAAAVVGGGDGAAGHGRVDDLGGDDVVGGRDRDGLVVLLGLRAHGRGRR